MSVNLSSVAVWTPLFGKHVIFESTNENLRGSSCRASRFLFDLLLRDHLNCYALSSIDLERKLIVIVYHNMRYWLSILSKIFLRSNQTRSDIKILCYIAMQFLLCKICYKYNKYILLIITVSANIESLFGNENVQKGEHLSTLHWGTKRWTLLASHCWNALDMPVRHLAISTNAHLDSTANTTVWRSSRRL